MDLKITEKKDESLLSRVKLTGEIGFEGATPSYDEVKKKLASSLNCDEKLITIKHIYTKFGIKKLNLFAYIYNNEEAMKKIEPKQKEKKKVKEEKPAEKPEEKKEEKETKEEKKPEEEPKEKPKEEPETPKKKEESVKKEEKNNQ